jgi:hypothetical protein
VAPVRVYSVGVGTTECIIVVPFACFVGGGDNPKLDEVAVCAFAIMYKERSPGGADQPSDADQ